MAPQASSKPRSAKKKRNRKARTEVSSSSSSSEISSSDSEAAPATKTGKSSKPSVRSSKPAGDRESDSPSASPVPQPSTAPKQTSEQLFQAFYLKQATREFSDDLEKLRNASDWKGQRSVDVLVRALGQGVGTFSPEERAAIGSGKRETERTEHTNVRLKE